MLLNNDSLSLNCALTRYLEKASSMEGVQASFAAAMLADLRHTQKDRERPDAGNVRNLLEILLTAGYRGILLEMSGFCKACRSLVGCRVGEIILSE